MQAANPCTRAVAPCTLTVAVLSTPGVEHEDDEMRAEAEGQNEGDSMSTGSMRRLLTQQLGAEAFSAAHARLRNVAEEEDDDSLVRDIQQILGPGKLDMLPIILKLIFQEEQGE